MTEARRVLVLIANGYHWGDIIDERRGRFRVRLGHKVRHNGQLTDIIEVRCIPTPVFAACCPLEPGEESSNGSRVEAAHTGASQGVLSEEPMA